MRIVEKDLVSFEEVEPSYWVGRVWVTFKKPDDNWNHFQTKFETKLDRCTRKYYCYYFNENRLVINYGFNSIEDLVGVLNLNIRLGVRY